jgi:hypothetical protein
VADDMMDASFTRRGQPCWYKVEKVGTIAINDSFMLEAALYRLLKKYYRKDPYYVDLLELFLDVRELNLFHISILIACRTHPPPDDLLHRDGAAPGSVNCAGRSRRPIEIFSRAVRPMVLALSLLLMKK